jgi:hypothetical protein
MFNPSTCASRDNSLNLGPIVFVQAIGVFHQYVHQGTGKAIHSVSQMRHFGRIVDDNPCLFGGKQRLETLDGYIIPMSICSGLPYMDMSHLLRRFRTLIPMFSSLQTRNGTHKMSLTSILLLT